MQRSRNRCGRERQDIHAALQCLDLLLVSHSKTLFLIHHQKAQILKTYILGKDPVCPNQDIHGSSRGSTKRL